MPTRREALRLIPSGLLFAEIAGGVTATSTRAASPRDPGAASSNPQAVRIEIEAGDYQATVEINSVSFSPDGTRVLSGSFVTTIKLWDAATGQLLCTFNANEVWSVAFSPDGARILSGGDDNMVKLWDAATGQLLRTFEGHSWSVRSVAFSPDGARIISGSGDKTMKLWDAATGQLLRTFEGHSDSVNSVAFSPDGARVVSGAAVPKRR